MSNSKNSNGKSDSAQMAFPGRPTTMGYQGGMTKREFMALELLSSMITNPDGHSYRLLLEEAIQLADTLIKELNKTEQPKPEET